MYLVPTHPPSHTPATHNPSIFGVFQPAQTTQNPHGTTTWATKPPSQPQMTTTKRPSFVITTPESVLGDDYLGESSCGAKNGNEVCTHTFILTVFINYFYNPNLIGSKQDCWWSECRSARVAMDSCFVQWWKTILRRLAAR